MKFILLVVILLLAQAGLADTVIQAQVDQERVTLEEILNLKIMIVQETRQSSLASRPQDPEIPALQGFVIGNQSFSQNINLINDKARVVLQYSYSLIPKEVGTFTIPVITYTYEEEGQSRAAQTKPIQVQVVHPPFHIRQPILLFILTAAVIIGVLCWLLGRSRRKVSPSTPPHSLKTATPYLPRLNSLRFLLTQDGTTPEVIEGIQETLKQYIQDQYNIGCRVKTTHEILTELENHPFISTHQYMQISTFLTHCDRSRFQPRPLTQPELQDLLGQLGHIVGLEF